MRKIYSFNVMDELVKGNEVYFSMYTCANGVFAYQHGDHFIGY